MITVSVNTIDNDSSKSKKGFAEDFWTFKKSFFAEVNLLKQQLLTSYATDNVNIQMLTNQTIQID